jgi:uncharacterized DUF497 family protein
MRFEWDEKKNQSNQQKHGLNFADAPRRAAVSHRWQPGRPGRHRRAHIAR